MHRAKDMFILIITYIIILNVSKASVQLTVPSDSKGFEKSYESGIEFDLRS